MITLGENYFRDIFLKDRPLIDVRAPIEFHEGTIPGAVNLPLLQDDERARVGTCYKEKGSEAAIELGHQIVSGEVKEARLKLWRDFASAHPYALVMCFRGGLRSQTVQAWLESSGVSLARVDGGYKKLRQFLIQEITNFCRQTELMVISGATGSGKTLLLREVQTFRPVCDLEALAHHRGSAFGGYGDGQPTQIDFENRLAVQLLKLQEKYPLKQIIIEDESRLIGHRVQPEILFDLLRRSSVVLIEESVATRVQVTYEDYILNSQIQTGSEELGLKVFESYLVSLSRIKNKLGGARYQEVQADLQKSIQDYKEKRELDSNRVWIEKLLVWYYDPLYFGSLNRREPTILFRGTRKKCFEYLKETAHAEGAEG